MHWVLRDTHMGTIERCKWRSPIKLWVIAPNLTMETEVARSGKEGDKEERKGERERRQSRRKGRTKEGKGGSLLHFTSQSRIMKTGSSANGREWNKLPRFPPCLVSWPHQPQNREPGSHLVLGPQAGWSGRQGPSEDPLWAFRPLLPVVRAGPQEAGSLQGHSLQNLMSNPQKNRGGSKD